MEAKELRCGNYVYGHMNEICVVEQLGSALNHNLVGYREIENIKSYGQNSQSGIPLTEEWLLKFGFIIRDKTYSLNYGGESMRYAYIEKPDFILYFHGRFGFNINEGKKNGDYCINSVHQLQNLYFAKTGKELVYNVV